jgi:2-dehydropantoate 2-reductase
MTVAEDAARSRHAYRVAVVGAGAVGGYLAAQAHAAGHRVTLCARAPLPGLRLDEAGRSRMVPVAIAGDPTEDMETADWVLLTTKAQDTAGADGWLRRLAGSQTVVAVLQNGLCHAERVAAAGVPCAVLPALVYVAVERVAPGHVVHHDGRLLVVPAGETGARFRDLWAGSAVEVRSTGDFHTAAWRKLLGNLAANPITALTMRRIDVLRDPDVAALARRVLEEGLAVARADGAQLGPEDIEAELRMYARVNPGGGSSMLYDRLAGRPLEHEYIIGEVVRRAERHGIPVPLNRALLTLLRALAASVPPSSG